MIKLTNMKIGKRLLLSFGLTFMVSLVLGLIGISEINELAKADAKMYDKITVPLGQMADMVQHFHMTRVQARELLLVEGDAEVKRVVESIRFLSKERETADADFEKTLLTENGRKVFGHYKTGMEEYSKLVDEVIQDVSAGNKAKALAVNKAKEPDLARRAQEGTDELVRLKVDIAKTTAQENARIAARAVTLTIVALAVGLIVAI